MKKKKLITVICLLLCVAIGVGVGVGVLLSRKKEEAPQAAYTMTLGGESDTHYNKSTPTDSYLVNTVGGVTDSPYVVLYPENASSVVRTAVDELIFFFKEATGITLLDMSDAQYDQNGLYISVGDTKLLEASGIQKHQGLGEEGTMIRTSGKNVLIIGGAEYGTLYGVYEFLRATFNYEFYSADCYEIDRYVRQKALYNYDILEIPDFDTRITGWGYSSINVTVMNRLRMHTIDEAFTAVGNKTFHNEFEWISESDYGDKHPNWFAPNRGESGPVHLCYTARGDAGELDAMADAVASKLKTMFKNDSEIRMLSFSMADNLEWCKCDACTASNLKYNGSNAAAVVKFLNMVVQKFDAWMASEEGKPYAREYGLVFLAYHELNTPPVKAEKVDGKYVPVDDTVIPHKNLGIFFAETNSDYTYSWQTDESDDVVRYRENLRAWSDLSTNGNLYWWLYAVGCENFFAPYNCFNGFQYYYQLARELGVTKIYHQGDTSQMGPALGWGVLKGYLSAKLAWNADYNVDYLIDKFFKGHYGAGADDMRQIFDEWLGHSIYQRDELGLSGSRSIFLDYQSAEFWPCGLITRWLELSNSAIAKIQAAGGENAERFEINCAVERSCYEYLYLFNYSSSMIPSERAALEQQFKNDVLSSGITMFSEKVSVTEAFLTLGIE